ncbi:hypothetical protein BDB01DRAFT_841998 [Pilobolus umbonatus]|nr:hypothetical protein BDB01DRAFT_841998 [Pilobolus umbonatus]
MQEHALSDYPNSEGIQTPTSYHRGRATIYSNNDTLGNNCTQQQFQQKQYPVLGVKMSRPCNVVSFSKAQPHLLAVGLDKVRNDPCLLVWDISRSISSYCNTPITTPTPAPFPLTKGFTYQETKAAIANQWRIDGRGHDIYEDRTKYNALPPISSSGSLNSKDQGPVRQYGPSEAISSCTWSEYSGTPLLIAGMGNKYLRVYDIRADQASNPLQFLTKAVYGTIVDPFNPYRLASYTEEGVIKVWDIRKENEAILTVNPENNKNSLSKILFSPSRPGFLASLSKDSNYINLWDIQETCSLQSAVNSSLTKEDEDLSIPVLWKSRKTASSLKQLSSFSFIPASVSSPLSNSNIHNILTMFKDGTLESVKVQEACQTSWQPTGGIIRTGRKGLLAYSPSTTSIDDKISRINLHDSPTQTKKDFISLASNIQSNAEKEIVGGLSSDISVIMRKRVIAGYSMDCEKNISLVGNDRNLKELWSWMQRAEMIAPRLSKVNNADYSFHGVYGIWMGSQSRNKSSPANTPRSNQSPKMMRQSPGLRPKAKEDAAVTDESIETADILPMVNTTKAAQRNLALSACGFAFDIKGFEVELTKLESREEYDKSAAWALFHGAPDRAIKALSTAKSSSVADEQQRKLMSAVLAGYQAGGTDTSNTWKSICESLSSDMVGRPYLRAIFAYIASNDWYRVLDEPELPLRERMAIALRVLDDEQMTNYLNKTVEKLVQQGDVEGMVVTGLTLKGIDLLEQAVDRYGDVQTASLIMSFIVPKRFKDKRVEGWVER